MKQKLVGSDVLQPVWLRRIKHNGKHAVFAIVMIGAVVASSFFANVLQQGPVHHVFASEASIN